MILSLDLPASKWKSLLPYLEPHIEESEVVEKLCLALQNTQLEESIGQRMYSFFLTHNLPLYNFPSIRKIQKHKGGPKLIKEVCAHGGVAAVKEAYFQFLEENFIMELKK